jgi:hypothetical protein
LLSTSSANGTKVATITRRIAAIRYAHALKDIDPLPTSSETVRATMKGIRRTAGAAPIRKAPATRPTIRKTESEIWFSWNPKSEADPVDVFLRKEPPPGASVVEANYADNPWFPAGLREEMEYDKRRDPDRYAHVWMGAYQRNSEARVFRNSTSWCTRAAGMWPTSWRWMQLAPMQMSMVSPSITRPTMALISGTAVKHCSRAERSAMAAHSEASPRAGGLRSSVPTATIKATKAARMVPL